MAEEWCEVVWLQSGAVGSREMGKDPTAHQYREPAKASRYVWGSVVAEGECGRSEMQEWA